MDRYFQNRSHGAGEIGPLPAGQEVELCGWAQKVRDLGGLLFLDLRDRSGVCQVVFDPHAAAALCEEVKKIRDESVVRLRGTIRRRPPGQVNPKLPTGAVEVVATSFELLSAADPLPFSLAEEAEAKEETRLRYRYLDLRRPALAKNFLLRHRLVQQIRRFFDEHGFADIETPFLTKSTPEGARDYLVPSRVNSGKFYALPQSPQMFKQLLMVAGFERYYQIVRCFRDEDLRADRQPEFTQLDVEISFADQAAVMALTEKLFQRLMPEILGVELPRPLPRLTYQEAMEKYGSDKPDLRLPLTLVKLDGAAAGSSFQVFANILGQGGTLRGLRLPGKASFSRKELEELTERAKKSGAKGLLWLKREGSELKSSLPKTLPAAEIEKLAEALSLAAGDLGLIVAGDFNTAVGALGDLRLHLGLTHYPPAPGSWHFCWVTDFPLLEYNAEDGRYYAKHHPFTAPLDEDLPYLESDPARVRAKAYDLTLNGTEIGGGSIRIHEREVQRRMFAALGFSAPQIQSQFGFFVEALRYGTPPHGGIAFGIDRLAMLLAGAQSLREVIAFPKTTSAQDLMSDSPSEVSPAQLHELALKLEGKK